MTHILPRLLIVVLLLQSLSGNIASLTFNLLHNISQSYNFFNPTISKMYGNYMYVQQAGILIHKINIITGQSLGAFHTNLSLPIVNDFIIFKEGANLAVCYNDNKLIIYDTSTFLEITRTITSSQCHSVLYLEDVDRLLWASQQTCIFSTASLTPLQDFTYAYSADKHKIVLSSNKQTYIDFMFDNTGNYYVSFGQVAYNISQIIFYDIQYAQIVMPYYNNRVYPTQNSQFDFYVLANNGILLISIQNGTANIDFQTVSLDPMAVLICFKQIALQQDRFAYVMQSSPKEVKFIGANSFQWANVFSIPQNIQGLQLSVDKRTLILILQTQILTYQIACTNSFYYDPLTFDCLLCDVKCQICDGSNGSCLSCKNGFYGQNCIPCHFSCQSCENSTGCLTCTINMTQIEAGLLCQATINSRNQTLTNNTAADTQNTNETKTGLIYMIHEGLFWFLCMPSAFRVPGQSQMLILIADFWIYSYHNRTYGQKINQVFELIQTIENKKWALMQFDRHLNITLSPLNIGLSNYSNYSNPKFLKVENKSSTLSESLLQFFVYMTPFVVLIFLLYRCIFNITFKYKISRHFRKYSLNVFLFFLLTEGNFEYICYCCFNQSLLVFFFNSVDRANAVVWVLFFFFVIIYAFGIFYITFWFYPKLSSKLIDEAYRFFPSFTIYTIMSNGKSFVLAAIQSLLFSFYKAQLFAILGVYMFLVAILLYSQIKYGIFKRAIFFNFMLLQITIKILINFLFLIQYCIQEGENDSFDVLEDSLIITLYVWAIVILFQIVATFFPQINKVQQPILQTKNRGQIQAFELAKLNLKRNVEKPKILMNENKQISQVKKDYRIRFADKCLVIFQDFGYQLTNNEIGKLIENQKITQFAVKQQNSVQNNAQNQIHFQSIVNNKIKNSICKKTKDSKLKIVLLSIEDKEIQQINFTAWKSIQNNLK